MSDFEADKKLTELYGLIPCSMGRCCNARTVGLDAWGAEPLEALRKLLIKLQDQEKSKLLDFPEPDGVA